MVSHCGFDSNSPMANERFPFLSCKLDHAFKINVCYMLCLSVCSGHTQNTFPTITQSLSLKLRIIITAKKKEILELSVELQS